MDEVETGERSPVLSPTLAPAVVISGTSSLSAREQKELREQEARIAAGIRSFRDVGGALLRIRDARLYRETHASFEAYCDEKWQLERARAYQFMAGATVVQTLPAKAGDMVRNEAQARALAPILRDRGVSGVEQVLAMAHERGAPMTAPLIRRLSSEVMNPNQPTEPTVTDRLVRDMGRLTSEYRSWLASGPSRKEKTTVKAAVESLTQSLA